MRERGNAVRFAVEVIALVSKYLREVSAKAPNTHAKPLGRPPERSGVLDGPSGPLRVEVQARPLGDLVLMHFVVAAIEEKLGRTRGSKKRTT